MLRHPKIERVCLVVMALALALALGFTVLATDGRIERSDRDGGYAARLFDTGYVHEIDIRMEDFDAFIDNCENEEYALCTLVIDGEKVQNAAIRAKGNTSLSQIAQYGNDRYSFKVEFDHYDDAISYHGLDKLSLNNLIQDKTLMKDYIAYTLMGKMGVQSSLASYVKLSVNGEYFGLYLAVEGVEDAFLNRNGTAQGDLYKPDSLSFGGGRGNGRDFDMDAFRKEWQQTEENGGQKRDMNRDQNAAPSRERSGMGGFDFGGMGGFGAGSSDVKLQYLGDDPDSYSNIFSSAKTVVTEQDQIRLIDALKRLSEGDESAVDRDRVLAYFAVHNFLCNDDSYTGQMIHNYYLFEQDGVLSMIPWDYNLSMGGFSMGMGSASGTVNEPIDFDLSDRPMVSWIFDDEESTAAYHQVYRTFAENYLANGWLQDEIARVSAMIAPYVQDDPTAFFTADEVTAAQQMLLSFVSARTESVMGQLDGLIPSTEDGQRADSSNLVDSSHIDLSAMGEFGMGGFGGGMQMPGGMDFGGFEMPEGFDFTNPGGMQMPENFDFGSFGGFEMPEGFDFGSFGNFGGFGGADMPSGATENAPSETPEATEEATEDPAEEPTQAPEATPVPAMPQMPGGFDFTQPGGGMQMPDGFDFSNPGGGMQMPDGFDFSNPGGGMQMPDGFDFGNPGGGMQMPDGFDFGNPGGGMFPGQQGGQPM